MELKNEVLPESKPKEVDDNEDEEDEEENEEIASGNESSKPKLRWPPSEATQEMNKRTDGPLYDQKVHFTSEADEPFCKKHQNPWDNSCPIENKWIFTENVKIAHKKYVKQQKRKLYFRPTVGQCKCKLPYNGKNDMLLVVTTGSQLYKQRVANLVSLSLLSTFSRKFFAGGMTMRAFYNSYKGDMMHDYGMREDEIITWQIWTKACSIFWNDVLSMNWSEVFACKPCGDLPPKLVFDGVSTGLKTKQVENYMHKLKLFSTKSSPTELKGSNYADRMFIKLQSNRNILKNSFGKTPSEWPVKEKGNIDPDYILGKKRKFENKKDSGMEQFWKMMAKTDQQNPPSEGFKMLMVNISKKTSTSSIFQVVHEALLEDFIL